MQKHKISIITATFNNEFSIESTIQSVLNQTYKNIEYIIIDGKSTDNTLEIIKNYADNISKVVSEKDYGIYDALNKGLLNATGEIIGFLHADDLFYDEYVLEKISDAFENYNVGAVYGNLQYVSKNETDKIIRNWISGDYKYSKLKKGWMPPHPTFYVKKDVYERFGNFNTKYKISADYDLMMRFIGLNKIDIKYLNEYFVKMRVGGKSNKSLRNIFLKMREDLNSMKKNKIGGFYTLFMKNISKLPQFFK